MASIWKWLTRPSDLIQDPEHRRQAQLLASILAVLTPTAGLVILYGILSTRTALDPSTLWAMATPVAMAGAYILSRTRYYRWGAGALIAAFFAALHLPMLSGDVSPNQLVYIIVPLLLSGIFFSAWVVLGVAVGSLGVMGLSMLFVPALTFETYRSAILYIIVTVPVVIIFMRHRDLVERDRQAVLKASEARWRSLVESAPATIVYTDLKGRVEFARLTDVNLDVAGKTFFDLMPPEYHDQIKAMIEQVVKDRQLAGFETEETLPNGRRVWRSTLVGPIYQDVQVTGLIFLITDVTAQKQVEQERNRLQQEMIMAQQEALRELSTPIIPVADGVIVMPLIGGIDTSRAREVVRALLAGIGTYRAQTAILDITGVPLIDSGVADHLNKAVQAARLKGTQLIITGISDAVAETVVDLGIDWSQVDTMRDLHTGLQAALRTR
ncbi:MAG: PAS domain S-box protein [Anaerolineae bacterium]|nr:PAS domain S-box protein [Anaerolineae bacterium]